MDAEPFEADAIDRLDDAKAEPSWPAGTSAEADCREGGKGWSARGRW